MRRLLATFLIAAICLPAVVLASSFSRPADLRVPACCRKDGKHHCGAMAMGGDQGLALRSANFCPVYPRTMSTPVFQGVAAAPPPASFFAGVVSHPALQAQSEARARVSLARGWQKRGPPFLSF